MTDRNHLFPRNTAITEQYTYPKDVFSGEFKLPPRDDRPSHGNRLIHDVNTAAAQARQLASSKPAAQAPNGLVLNFESDPGFKLRIESLEMRASGIELCSSRIDSSGVMHATVFVPPGKTNLFINRFEAYIKQDSGKRDYKTLVESITRIRLATLSEFWRDASDFPEDGEALWWEVWLRDTNNSHDVIAWFRKRAAAAQVIVGERALKFPERCVLIAQATISQLTQIEDFFDFLAELRRAKTLAGEFLTLPPRDQAEFVLEAKSRIHAPSADAPSVCHLDTGVNRSHPLLDFALSPQHLLSVEPGWSATDIRGHGTEMVGLALYGCLTTLLNSNTPVVLQHRLESVKLLPDTGYNVPELYGELTSQAVSRVTVAAPLRSRRAFCLTVTADSRDEGYPSSWSAAVDQICSAAMEEKAQQRLVIVSAGNVPPQDRHEYPDRNQVSSVEDPAQSWNALTVGASTHLTTIQQADYLGWQPIATAGSLSPSSRTSISWADRSWAIKPDIVMEGGNCAIDPGTNRADHVDDLSLLTTRVSPTGALLTSTSDTSAATALASRYAAILWAHYPNLWPESVRGLLVHSARWSDRMLAEFPHEARHNRLRCYGHGIPDLHRAIWSASNAATLVVEGSLQPFYKAEDKTIKTKDMQIHQLPWPTAVLSDLAEVEVQMRVTLSYFIEPSPGRRGWNRKHRYQSHGLRFDVKRPLETDDEFRKRLSKAARSEDEEVEIGADDRAWELGDYLRRKGSIHSDVWSGTAAALANCGVLAVFPVTGWWKERPHLDRWHRQARYSLIVSIETASDQIDLYTPIAAQIAVPVEAAI